MDVAYSIT